MSFLNENVDLGQLAEQKKQEYQSAEPFPNIVFDNFFDAEMLDAVLSEFPDLSLLKETDVFNNHNEKKIGAKGETGFGLHMRQLMHYMNSEPVLKFLQQLTGIEETLIPDPYFIGGGCHEIKPGGWLKIHADFNKHRLTGLDRRINVLIYLNKNWEEAFGGHFELWDRDMTTSVKKVLPVFNRIAIFSTTDFSYHGHPNPLTCPENRSRKSLALYYYTNGRPASEVDANLNGNTTSFIARKDISNDVKNNKRSVKTILLDFIPPIVTKIMKRKR